MLGGGERRQGIAEAVDYASYRGYFSWTCTVHPHAANDGPDSDEKNVDRERQRNFCERPVLRAHQRFDEHTPGIDCAQTDLHNYGSNCNSPPTRKTLLCHCAPQFARAPHNSGRARTKAIVLLCDLGYATLCDRIDIASAYRAVKRRLCVGIPGSDTMCLLHRISGMAGVSHD